MNAAPIPWSQYRLVISGTDGLVARHAQRVLIIPRLTSETFRQAERLVQLCLDDGVPDGSSVLRQAAHLLSDPTATSMPGFCLVVASADMPTRLLVHGAVHVELPAEAVTLSAADHLTWIEHRVTDPAGLNVDAAGAVGAAGADNGVAAALIDLKDGVVAGSRATLMSTVTAPSPLVVSLTAEIPAPEVLPTKHQVTRRHPISLPPSFDAVLLTGEPTERPGDPLPTSNQGRQEQSSQGQTDQDRATTDSSRVMVEGIVCSRGHFNDPGSVYCPVCGISMVQRTHEYVSGLRPPLGVLLFDDGSVFTIDGNYILGREPEFDRAVVTAQARPLTLSDPENGVSRVHAELRLEEWRVLLEDRGSSNGTFVSRSLTGDWQRLEPGQPVELSPGHQIRFGDRSAIYEPHLRQR